MSFLPCYLRRALAAALVAFVLPHPAKADVGGLAASSIFVRKSVVPTAKIALRLAIDVSGLGKSPPSAPAAEVSCLAEAVYFEARSEPVLGQLLVGRVILNRVDTFGYPKTICGVVHQNAQLRNACQFSYACDGKPDDVTEIAVWQAIRARAAWLANCGICRWRAFDRTPIAASTNYHADYVSPRWALGVKPTGKVGHHIFYFTVGAPPTIPVASTVVAETAATRPVALASGGNARAIPATTAADKADKAPANQATGDRASGDKTTSRGVPKQTASLVPQSKRAAQPAGKGRTPTDRAEGAARGDRADDSGRVRSTATEDKILLTATTADALVAQAMQVADRSNSDAAKVLRLLQPRNDDN